MNVERGVRAIPVRDVDADEELSAGAVVEEVVAERGVRAMPVNNCTAGAAGAAEEELLGVLLGGATTAR